MKITLKNQEYYVNFPEVSTAIDSQKSNARAILCNIKNVREDGKTNRVSSAVAICLKKQFVRTVTEKAALASAMKRAGWDRATRTLVWEAYLTSSSKRRKLIGLKVVPVNKLETV